jgi:SAM-dependent methyltransferase
MALEPSSVLDVGCGTGKAAGLFAARGCEVLGVEPDPRMAAVARSHGLNVEIATFETWQPADRIFDLVISGQAWHWVQVDVGAAKAADVLRRGGVVGVFWNYFHLEGEMKAALRDAYQANAPDLLDSHVLGGRARDAHVFRDAMASDRRLARTWIRQYDWSCRLSAAVWLDVLAAQPDHRRLPDDQRAPLLTAVADVVAGLGGSVLVRYETELLTARRLAD